MNIVVDNGAYRMDNMGDVAMLQVTVARIRRHWPDANVRVITEAPDRLRSTCPDVEPLLASPWHVLPVLPRTGRLRSAGLRRMERRAMMLVPRLTYLGKRQSARRRPGAAPPVERYYRALREADAIICSGGGYLNDWHAEHADKVIQTLAIAQGMGKPTAMFGAGLGPMDCPSLRAYVRPVLRRLDMLALREQQASCAELERLGLALNGAVVTGDDALELNLPSCTASRPSPTRRAIGINLRITGHAGAASERASLVAPAVRHAADALGAPLVAAPIRCRLSPQNDVDAVAQIFEGSDVDLSLAQSVERPVGVLQIIRQCRVVVTGAYHAAVFALAQGTPVVALSGSIYYDRKFGGLAHQFKGGITILNYRDADLPGRLSDAIAAAWRFDGAHELVSAAERQIAASRAAYESFFDLLDTRAASALRAASLTREPCAS